MAASTTKPAHALAATVALLALLNAGLPALILSRFRRTRLVLD